MHKYINSQYWTNWNLYVLHTICISICSLDFPFVYYCLCCIFLTAHIMSVIILHIYVLMLFAVTQRCRSYTQILSIPIFTTLFFAVAFRYLLLQCGIFPQPRSWKIDLITERWRLEKKKKKKTQRENRIVGKKSCSISDLVFCSCQLLLLEPNSAQHSSQILSTWPQKNWYIPAQPTHPHTRRHKEAFNDRHGLDGREDRMQWERLRGWWNILERERMNDNHS